MYLRPFILALLVVCVFPVHAADTASVVDSSQTEISRASPSRLQQCKRILGDIALAPLTTLFEGVGLIRNQDGWAGVKRYGKRSIRNLALYAALSVGLTSISNKYFVTSQSDFLSPPEQYLSQNSERVLVINGSTESDWAFGSVKILLQNRYGQSKEVRWVSVSSLEELKSQQDYLAATTDHPYDRIEFFAHGMPQGMKLGNTVISNEDIARTFQAISYSHLSNPSSAVRFWSCRLGSCASNSPAERNHEIESTWAKILIPQGGQVVVSPRTIETRSFTGEGLMHLHGVYPLSKVFITMFPAAVNSRGTVEPKAVVLTFDETGKITKEERLK